MGNGMEGNGTEGAGGEGDTSGEEGGIGRLQRPESRGTKALTIERTGDGGAKGRCDGRGRHGDCGAAGYETLLYCVVCEDKQLELSDSVSLGVQSVPEKDLQCFCPLLSHIAATSHFYRLAFGGSRPLK